ncbi:unnamed protein product [Paramecium pentaurelia]|uniref:TLDc domain-containing protein n=1 Tax=Paramecium pentaurelia TaxID=43138 RepID=A0A8S1UUT3_9CILI|nr:unnamed protein product [Paramecium pentaurelia]
MEASEPQMNYEPKERIQFNIECEDFNHKGELVQFILLKQKTDLRSRLLCRKCIEGKFNQQTNEICLISDVMDDPLNALKFTNYQDNVNQTFSDFLHSYDFSFDKDAIQFKINEIKQNFLYFLDKLEKKLIEKCETFQETKSNFDSLGEKFAQCFDTENLKNSLNEAQEKFGKITTKDKQKLRMDVNTYVKNLHSLNKETNSEQYQKLFDQINENKKNLASREKQLRLFKFKLDQGLDKILQELKNMEETFCTLNLRQSELSTSYMDELITKINPIFKERNNFQDKIKKIYSSKDDGLNSLQVTQKINNLGQLNLQTLLFIFQTSSQQTFGVYFSQNSSQIFHQNKRQEFPIKSNITPLIINYNQNQSDILMTFGQKDILIKSSFIGCSSNLGEGFIVNPKYQIGHPKSHLANQEEFDIVQMEIFQILK